MKLFFTLGVFLSFSITTYAQEVQSVSFESCTAMDATGLSKDELKDNLTTEEAWKATQYNDIAKNKIRGICKITVTSVNGKSKNGKDDPNSVTEGACKYTSDLSVINFDVRKYANSELKSCSSTGCIPNNITLCIGQAICNDGPPHGTQVYNIACLGYEGKCPGVQTCVDDPYVMPGETQKMNYMNSIAPQTKAKQQ